MYSPEIQNPQTLQPTKKGHNTYAILCMLTVNR